MEDKVLLRLLLIPLYQHLLCQQTELSHHKQHIIQSGWLPAPNEYPEQISASLSRHAAALVPPAAAGSEDLSLCSCCLPVPDVCASVVFFVFRLRDTLHCCSPDGPATGSAFEIWGTLAEVVLSRWDRTATDCSVRTSWGTVLPP